MIRIPNTKYNIDLKNNKVFFNNEEIIDVNGLYKIELFNGIEIEKTFDWLKHLTKLNLIFNMEYMFAIDYIEYHKYKPFGVSIDYDYIPIFRIPVYIHGTKYRLIARYPMYGITYDGNVFSLYTNSLLKTEDINVFIYKRIRLLDQMVDKKRIPAIHKLVALSWVDNDDYEKNNIIDHIDKNKLNNHYKNLRWSNNSKNVSRSIDKYCGFIVRNIQDNIIHNFDTIYEVSNHIGLLKIDLSRQPILNSRVWKTKKGVFEVTTNSKLVHKNIIHNNGIKQMKNINTKKVYTSKTTSELIKITNIPKSTITKYLDLGWDYKAIHGWLIRYESDKPWADDVDTMILYNPNNIKIELVYLDKIIKTYNSISEASKDLSISNKTIMKKLRNKIPILYNNLKCCIYSLL